MSRRSPSPVAPGWVWDGVSSLNYPHAAKVLGVPVGWLKEKVPAGEVPCSRLGKHVVFTPDDIATIRQASRRPAKDTQPVRQDDDAFRAQLRTALVRNAA